jgi:ubiquitin-conjugating enzyme E2 O
MCLVFAQVGLADRSLMPGDVVRQMIKGKDTQRGYCRYIDMSANVQIIGTNLVITNIQSAKLTPLEVIFVIIGLKWWA